MIHFQRGDRVRLFRPSSNLPAKSIVTEVHDYSMFDNDVHHRYQIKIVHFEGWISGWWFDPAMPDIHQRYDPKVHGE